MLGRCHDQTFGSKKVQDMYTRVSYVCWIHLKRTNSFQVAKIVGDESLGLDYQGPLKPTWIYPYFKLMSYGLSMHK